MLLLAALFLIGAAVSLVTAQFLDPRISRRVTWDLWFDADCFRAFGLMTGVKDWGPMSHRLHAHPFFPTFIGEPVQELTRIAQIPPGLAVQGAMAAAAGCWSALIFTVLRLVGRSRFEAALFTLLACVSAAGIFWSAPPETFLFGSLSILAVLVIAALAERRPIPQLAFVAAGLLSFGITVTNCVAGLAAAFCRLPRRQAFAVTAAWSVIAVLLWVVVQPQFPSSRFLRDARNESVYVCEREALGAPAILRSFFFHSVVMPEVRQIPKRALLDYRTILSVQSSALGSGGAGVLLGEILWALLLGAGVVGLVRPGARRSFRVVLAATLLGHLVLHLIYGAETFLYALHFTPLLVLVAAYGLETRARRAVLVGAGLLVMVAGCSNFGQFHRSAAAFRDLAARTEAATVQRGRLTDSSGQLKPGREASAPHLP